MPGNYFFQTTKRFSSRILMFGLLVVLAGLTLSRPAHAQEPIVHFEHLTLDDGLSDNTVYSIVQDQTGFMWFGTQNGLNKYDGYQFTVYRSDAFNPNTVSNDNAGNIYIDHDGIIWIGTWGGGLDRLNPRTGQFKNYSPDPQNPKSLGYDRVQTIFQDSRGAVWVGTAGAGLDKLDSKTGTFSHYRNNPNNPDSLSNDRIWKIDEDRQGNLWIATSEGLNKYNPQTDTFTRYFNDPNDPASLSHSLIRTLYIDRSGTLWVGTEKGLNKFDPATNTFQTYFHKPDDPASLSDDIINAIYEDSTDRFWIGTRSGGLDLMDRRTGAFRHYVNDPLDPGSLAYNDIRYITEDRSGILWIATRGGGVDRLAPTSGQFIHYAGVSGNLSVVANNEVRAIFEDDDGRLWLGNKGSGLNIFDPSTGQYMAYANNPNNPNSLSSNDVYAIYKDRQGIFWLGTSGGGLDSYNPANGTFTRYNHNPNDPTSLSSSDVNVIFEDSAGTLWIGTKGGGLDKFDRASGTFTVYKNNPNDPASLGNDDVYAIYEDSADRLWVGTYGGGLNQFDPVTGTFVRYEYNPENPNSLSDNNIYSIFQTGDDTMWIATANGGLNQFNPQTGQTTAVYSQKDGLASDVVYSILSDKAGNLWLSTNKGLSKFIPSENRFVNYGVADGLKRVIYREGASFKGQDGALFFGGINGLTKFYPDKISENTHVPPVVLTGLSLFNQPLKLNAPAETTNHIQLSYQDDVLSFDFAALDFVAPQRNQYAYKLEGFDDDWIYAGNRTFATYTNLDPGNYTFRVKGANNAGVWNEDGVSINVTITPPFWETWWFRTLAVFGILAIAFGGYKLRVRAIDHHRKLLKRQVAERTAALREANEHLQQVTTRLQDELALAKKIQQGLLPSPQPRWSGPEVVCFSKPAREVGGDFYDYYAFAGVSNNPERFAVIVGDVSGKGMPAALLMAVSLGSLQSIMTESPKKEDLLDRLDSTLKPYSQTTSQNCALCYTEISNGSLSAINAGGIAPILRRANSHTHWLDTIGLPLGVTLERKPSYREATVKLDINPGDLVVLVSDGVIEAMAAGGEMFGFDRLEQAVAAGPTHSAADMLAHLNETVHDFLGTVDPEDDLTIVVVKV